MIKSDAIARANMALDRIEHVLKVYDAVREFASRGWKLDA